MPGASPVGSSSSTRRLYSGRVSSSNRRAATPRAAASAPAGAVAARAAIDALEGLEQARQRRGVEAIAVVDDLHDAVAVARRGRDRDAAAGAVVADGVLDEVRHEAL